MAKEAGINYSTAKVIMRIFREEGRVEKKSKKFEKRVLVLFFKYILNDGIAFI